MKWSVARYSIFLLLCIVFSGIVPVFLNAKPLLPRLANQMLDNNTSEHHISSSEMLPEVELSLDELRLFVEVMQRIKGAYVDPIDDALLMKNAIKGMVEGLDAHSSFLSPQHLRQLRETTMGKFAGIGIEVDVEKEAIYVVKPLPNTPASRAGILPGDRITHLSGVAIKKLSPDQIAAHMRGTPGSRVALVVVREGHNQPLHLSVVREIIHLSSVEYRLLEQGYGYVRINQFQRNTGQELIRGIIALQKEKRLNGLVLDLRDNPGGVLQAAVDVADVFLREGVIVSTQGRLVGSDLTFTANEKDITQGLPLVVLINEHSASASEIVAGALQDHKRAVIVGKRSYGKGSVQSILPLLSSYQPSGLKLTTARYYTPDGRSIQSKGIVPDIHVETEKKRKGQPFKDTQLFRALGIVKSMEYFPKHNALETLSEAVLSETVLPKVLP